MFTHGLREVAYMVAFVVAAYVIIRVLCRSTLTMVVKLGLINENDRRNVLAKAEVVLIWIATIGLAFAVVVYNPLERTPYEANKDLVLECEKEDVVATQSVHRANLKAKTEASEQAEAAAKEANNEAMDASITLFRSVTNEGNAK